jgi:hypothetical protein
MRGTFLSSILLLQFRKGVLLDMANSILETISSEFASAAEKVGSSVVAVHARRWMPTSGIEWKKGVVVTACSAGQEHSRPRQLRQLPPSCPTDFLQFLPGLRRHS